MSTTVSQHLTLSGLVSRDDYRQYGLQQRRQLTARQRQTAHTQILALAQKQQLFKRNTTIGFYLSMPTEVNTCGLINLALQSDCRIAVPVMTNHEMLFQLFIPESTTLHKHMGFTQPRYDKTQVIALHDIDQLWLPLSCVDLQGNRLGLGQGYYDRALATVQNRKKQPVRIGLAYQRQVVSQLPYADWDVPLQYLLTDQQWFAFKK